MNAAVKAKHPDLYKDAFAADRLAFPAGASLVVFPLMGVMVSASLGSMEKYAVTINPVVAAVIGFVIAVVLNAVFFARRGTQKQAEAELLSAAMSMFPGTQAHRTNDETLYFERFKQP